MAGISLRNITKIYPGGVTAVHNFSLEIEDKEFVVLVGPSGCGKSTLLRMISGLEEITEGELYIGDRLVNNVEPKDRDIAMVFQNYALYPHMSVYKNMAFSLKLRKEPKDVIERKVREAARILDIEALLNRRPKALSGGQRQRVALGRAMVRDPAVFLLDEPLSNLDAKLRASMRAEISKLHRNLGTTFVYVTHDQTEAMTMGDRIVVMNNGYVQQVDTPQNLYNNPQNLFVAGFIGTPPMNFIEGVVVRGDTGYLVETPGGNVPIPPDRFSAEQISARQGKKVILGIRPENLHLDIAAIAQNDAGLLTAQVELAEMMGSELYVYANCAGNNLIGRVPATSIVHTGEVIRIAVDSGKMHLFDDESKQAIV